MQPVHGGQFLWATPVEEGEHYQNVFPCGLGDDQVQPLVNGWWWMWMNISGFNYLFGPPGP